jgi:hypothetical protein
VAIPIQPNQYFCVRINAGSYVASGGLNRLKAMKVKKVNAQGRYPDGNYSYRVVGASGAKHWPLRTVVRGKPRDMGLSSASLVDPGVPWSSTSGKLNWPVKG